MVSGIGTNAGFDVIVIAPDRQSASNVGHFTTPASATPTNSDVSVSLLSATARSNDSVVAVMLSAYRLPATNVILFVGAPDGLPPFLTSPASGPAPQARHGGKGNLPVGASPTPLLQIPAGSSLALKGNLLVIPNSTTNGCRFFIITNPFDPLFGGVLLFATLPSGLERSSVAAISDPQANGDQFVVFSSGRIYKFNAQNGTASVVGSVPNTATSQIASDGTAFGAQIGSSGSVRVSNNGFQTGFAPVPSTGNQPAALGLAGSKLFVAVDNKTLVFTFTNDPTATPSQTAPLKSVVNSKTSLSADHANATTPATDSDPVRMFDLEFIKDVPPDLARGGPLPLTFERSYASARRTSGFLISALGDNWGHNFDWRVVASATNALVISAHGRGFSFVKSNGVWSLISPTFASFQLKDSGANLVFGDPRTRRLYTFNSSGQPIRIADEHGNAHALAYSGALLASVADGLGRSLVFNYDSSNRLATLTADDGRSIGFSYGSNSELTAFTNALGNTTTFAYVRNLNTGNQNLTAITNALGNVPLVQIYNGHDGVGNQYILGTNNFVPYSVNGLNYPGVGNQIRDPLGNTRYFYHSAGGSITQLVDEAGIALNVSLDAAGRPVAITDRNGNTSQFSRDPTTGLPTAIITADSNATPFAYVDRAVQGIVFQDLTQVTYPDGATTRFRYDATGNVLAVTNRAGQPMFYGYNSRGQITAITNSVGGVVTFSYYTNGTVAARTDAETGTTTLAYDASRRLTNTVFSDGTSISASYDVGDRLVSATDQRGNTTTFAYDANDRLVAVNNPLGQFMSFVYDAADRLINIRDFAGKVVNYTYDPLSRVSAVTDPLGNITRFGFDSRGRLSAITNATGKVWKLGYDAQARLISATNPVAQAASRALNKTGFTTATTNALGAVARLGRDSLQRVTTSTDEPGRVFTNSYDVFAALGGIANSAIGRVNYFRDAGGRLTNLVDQTAGSWKFGWTPLGRLQNFSDPLNRATTFSRDTRGRVQRVGFADGASVTNSYDFSDNLTRARYSDGTDQPFAYDSLGRLTNANNLALAFDAMGRVTNIVSSGTNFAAAYDAAGRLTSATYNGGAFSVTYAYDARGLLTNISDTLSGARISLAYDAAGRLTNSIRANGVNGIYDYDANGRLVRLREGGIIDQQLTSGPAGEPAMITVTAPVVAPPPLQSRTLAFDAVRQISTAGYAFDARGRQTAAPGHTFGWNAVGRLTSADTAAFTYNGLNQLLTRAQSGVTTRYHYNHALGLAPVVAEQDAGGGQILRYYVWSPGGALLYMIDAANGNAVSYFHFDHLGSTLALTSAAGATTDAYSYTPYGELTARTGSNPQPFTYIGMWGVRSEPAANLYDMRARYYDPATSRFLSRDPKWPRLGDPLSANPYEYAARNPMRFIDPLGTEEGLDLYAVATRIMGFPNRDPINTGLRSSALPDQPCESPTTKAENAVAGSIKVIESVLPDLPRVFVTSSGIANMPAARGAMVSWADLSPEAVKTELYLERDRQLRDAQSFREAEERRQEHRMTYLEAEDAKEKTKRWARATALSGRWGVTDTCDGFAPSKVRSWSDHSIAEADPNIRFSFPKEGEPIDLSFLLNPDAIFLTH